MNPGDQAWVLTFYDPARCRYKVTPTTVCDTLEGGSYLMRWPNGGLGAVMRDRTFPSKAEARAGAKKLLTEYHNSGYDWRESNDL